MNSHFLGLCPKQQTKNNYEWLYLHFTYIHLANHRSIFFFCLLCDFYCRMNCRCKYYLIYNL